MDLSRRRMLQASAALGVAAVASACSSSTGSTTASSKTSSTKLPGWLTDLYQKAITHGDTTFNYYPTSTGLDPVIEAFQKTFPKVTTNYKYLLGPQLTAQVNAEFASGKHTIDVAQGGQVANLSWYQAGRTQRWVPPAGSGISSNRVYFDHNVYTDSLVLFTSLYNTKMTTKAKLPTDLDGFTSKEWVSKTGVTRPDGGLGVDECLTTLYSEHLMTSAQMAGLAKLPTEAGTSALLSAVSQGQFAAGLWLFAPAVLAAIKEHAPVALGYSPTMTVKNENPTSIMKGAPHPYAAQLWMGWVLSEVGQREMVKTGFYSILPGMGNPPGQPDISNLKVEPVPLPEWTAKASATRVLSAKYWP